MKLAVFCPLALVLLAATLLADEQADRAKYEKQKAAAKKAAAPKAANKPAAREDDDEAPSQAELDKQFEKLLSGATLAGQYTVAGADATSVPKEEKYSISKVSKIAGELWLLQVRIQYGDHDVNVPIPVPVKWVGSTPMIVLDKVNVPMLGTFSARVVFHEGKYAGTWSGGDHGGHIFGRVLPPAGEDEEKKDGDEKAEKE